MSSTRQNIGIICLLLLFLLPCNSYSQKSSFNIIANCSLESHDNGLLHLGFKEIVLSPEQKSSSYMATSLTWDEYKAFILSLHYTSDLIDGSEKHKIYRLTLTRVDDDLRLRQDLGKIKKNKKNLKGVTTSAIEIIALKNGEFRSSYIDEDNKYVRDVKGIPEKVSISYSVPRGFLEPRQNLVLSCDLELDNNAAI